MEKNAGKRAQETERREKSAGKSACMEKSAWKRARGNERVEKNVWKRACEKERQHVYNYALMQSYVSFEHGNKSSLLMSI